MNASPAAVPSTTSTDGGMARATSSPSSSRTAPSSTEREGNETVGTRERLELEAVDDGEVRVDRDPPGRRGIEAEHSRRLLPGGDDGVIGDLLLTQDRVGRCQVEAADERVCPRRDDDRRLSLRIDGDQRNPRRLVDLAEIERDPGLTQARQSLSGERIPPDGCHHADICAEPGARDGLVGALASREPFERRPGDGLAGARKHLAARDEVEVDRPDDRDPRSRHRFSVCEGTPRKRRAPVW